MALHGGAPFIMRGKHLGYRVVSTSELICEGCGRSASELSPFRTASNEDEWGGYRPWDRYRLEKDGTYIKRPYGRRCRICVNVYNGG
eukprot:4747589-Amphidinium_carterae.1